MILEGLREEWEPHPARLWIADVIGFLLLLVNLTVWPFVLWALIS